MGCALIRHWVDEASLPQQDRSYRSSLPASLASLTACCHLFQGRHF